MLAALHIASAIDTVLLLVVAGVIFGLLMWLIDFCKTPEPFRQVARIVLAVAAVLVVIHALLSLIGYPLFVA